MKSGSSWFWLLLWVGCAQPPATSAPQRAPRATPVLDGAVSPRAESAAGAGTITIPFSPTATCAGGQLLVDGVMTADYPVAGLPIPSGRRVLHIESAGDCAGYGDLTIDVVSGVAYVLPPERFRR